MSSKQQRSLLSADTARQPLVNSVSIPACPKQSRGSVQGLTVSCLQPHEKGDENYRELLQHGSATHLHGGMFSLLFSALCLIVCKILLAFPAAAEQQADIF